MTADDKAHVRQYRDPRLDSENKRLRSVPQFPNPRRNMPSGEPAGVTLRVKSGTRNGYVR